MAGRFVFSLSAVSLSNKAIMLAKVAPAPPCLWVEYLSTHSSGLPPDYNSPPVCFYGGSLGHHALLFSLMVIKNCLLMASRFSWFTGNFKFEARRVAWQATSVVCSISKLSPFLWRQKICGRSIDLGKGDQIVQRRAYRFCRQATRLGFPPSFWSSLQLLLDHRLLFHQVSDSPLDIVR